MKKLLICEKKKDQAIPIAKALGLRPGKNCFEGKFKGQDICLVWARGHLLSLKTPSEIDPRVSWSDPRTLRPIPRVFELKVTDLKNAPAAAQPKAFLDNIARHMREADEVWIGTDADREGEAVGWHILEHLGWTGPVRRAWFAGGLDKKSVEAALSNLKAIEETKAWYYAADARGRADWAYMYLVRAYTFYAQHSCMGDHLGYGEGRSRVVSVGRVQTPALSMIYDREMEIRNFVPVDHFKVLGDFALGNGILTAEYRPHVTQEIIDSQPSGVTWEPSREIVEEGKPLPLDRPLFTGKSEVDAFRRRLEAAAADAFIHAYEKRRRKRQPPKTYDLATAQSDLCRQFGISAVVAQTVFEDLYEQGWTSYARTSHAELPASFYEPGERNVRIDAVMQLPALTEAAKTARAIHDGTHPTYKPFRPAVFSTKEMNHFGIVPTAQVMTPADFETLTPKKKTGEKIEHTKEHLQGAYLLVAKRFIQALYPPAEIDSQTVEIHVPVEDLLGHKVTVFTGKGEQTVDLGWLAAFGEAAGQNTTFEEPKKGTKALLKAVNLEASKTRPPARYNEPTFPEAMSKIGKYVRDPKLRRLLNSQDLGKSQGIGTPSTRSEVIATLKAREYIKVAKNGAIEITPKGIDLIEQMDDWLRIPETTAQWEDFLCDLCEVKDMDLAQQMRDEFVNKQIDLIEEHLKQLEERFLANLGPRRSTPSRVTPNMKTYIQDLARRKGIEIPRGTLTDPVKAKAFLDEHAEKRAPGDNKPSEKQLKLAKSIISNLPADVASPPNVLTDRKACSDFIDANKKYLPPSDAQIGYARKLFNEMPPNERPPEEKVFSSAIACSAFIDQRTRKGSASKQSKKRASGSKRRPSRGTASRI